MNNSPIPNIEKNLSVFPLYFYLKKTHVCDNYKNSTDTTKNAGLG